MNTKSKKMILFAFVAAAVSMPNVLTAVSGPQATVGVTRSMIVETGTTVTLAASTNLLPNIANPRFRWLKDEYEVYGKTNSTYAINNASLSDAAEYTVIVYATGISAEAEPFYLSVYMPVTNSNGGVMATPVGDFTGGGPYNPSCGGSFDRYKTYFPFDGPYTSPASPTYPNTSNSPNLNVTTCTNVNGATLDTAIRIQDNFGTGTERACSNDYCSLENTKLSGATFNALQTNKTYRVTIYFKGSTLGSLTTVTFLWLYY